MQVGQLREENLSDAETSHVHICRNSAISIMTLAVEAVGLTYGPEQIQTALLARKRGSDVHFVRSIRAYFALIDAVIV